MLGITAIILGVVAVISVMVKHRYPRYEKWFPNWVAIGLGFTIPAQSLAFAMVCGATAAYLMNKYKPRLWEIYGYPLAAGFSAGEACSGLVNAGLVIAGVDGAKVGTSIGCPWGDC